MNQLAKQNNQLAIQDESRLKECNDTEFKKFLNDEIYKLFLKNGQNAPDPRDVQLIRNELYNHLLHSWPGVKIEWIKGAFHNGINGNYGDFANISYRLMNDWINKYRYSMRREDFGVQEEPMNTGERSEFILKNRDKLPSVNELYIKHKSKRGKKSK